MAARAGRPGALRGPGQRLREFAATKVASSVEPKAAQTAARIAGQLDVPVELVDGLHEHDRRGSKHRGKDEFARAVAALFAWPHALVFGRETADAALARLDAPVAGLIEAAPARDDLIVVSHGMLIALFVAAHTGPTASRSGSGSACRRSSSRIAARSGSSGSRGQSPSRLAGRP